MVCKIHPLHTQLGRFIPFAQGARHFPSKLPSPKHLLLVGASFQQRSPFKATCARHAAEPGAVGSFRLGGARRPVQEDHWRRLGTAIHLKICLTNFKSKQSFGHDGDGQGGPPGRDSVSSDNQRPEVLSASIRDRAEAYSLLQKYHPRAFFFKWIGPFRESKQNLLQKCACSLRWHLSWRALQKKSRELALGK